jgi:hypothetical protein
MENTGGFASAIGGMSPALQEAIQRRSNPSAGGGALNQVSPTARTFDPNNQPPQAPGGGLPQAQTPSTPSTQGSPGLPANSGEAKIIISALKERLQTISKIQESGGTI